MPEKITLGQIADVIKAAEALAPLDNGNAAGMRVTVKEMASSQLFEIIQACSVIRRVAREWNVTPVEQPRGIDFLDELEKKSPGLEEALNSLVMSMWMKRVSNLVPGQFEKKGGK